MNLLPVQENTPLEIPNILSTQRSIAVGHMDNKSNLPPLSKPGTSNEGTTNIIVRCPKCQECDSQSAVSGQCENCLIIQYPLAQSTSEASSKYFEPSKRNGSDSLGLGSKSGIPQGRKSVSALSSIVGPGKKQIDQKIKSEKNTVSKYAQELKSQYGQTPKSDTKNPKLLVHLPPLTRVKMEKQQKQKAPEQDKQKNEKIQTKKIVILSNSLPEKNENENIDHEKNKSEKKEQEKGQTKKVVILSNSLPENNKKENSVQGKNECEKKEQQKNQTKKVVILSNSLPENNKKENSVQGKNECEKKEQQKNQTKKVVILSNSLPENNKKENSVQGKNECEKKEQQKNQTKKVVILSNSLPENNKKENSVQGKNECEKKEQQKNQTKKIGILNDSIPEKLEPRRVPQKNQENKAKIHSIKVVRPKQVIFKKPHKAVPRKKQIILSQQSQRLNNFICNLTHSSDIIEMGSATQEKMNKWREQIVKYVDRQIIAKAQVFPIKLQLGTPVNRPEDSDDSEDLLQADLEEMAKMERKKTVTKEGEANTDRMSREQIMQPSKNQTIDPQLETHNITDDRYKTITPPTPGLKSIALTPAEKAVRELDSSNQQKVQITEPTEPSPKINILSNLLLKHGSLTTCQEVDAQYGKEYATLLRIYIKEVVNKEMLELKNQLTIAEESEKNEEFLGTRKNSYLKSNDCKKACLEVLTQECCNLKTIQAEMNNKITQLENEVKRARKAAASPNLTNALKEFVQPKDHQNKKPINFKTQMLPPITPPLVVNFAEQPLPAREDQSQLLKEEAVLPQKQCDDLKKRPRKLRTENSSQIKTKVEDLPPITPPKPEIPSKRAQDVVKPLFEMGKQLNIRLTDVVRSKVYDLPAITPPLVENHAEKPEGELKSHITKESLAMVAGVQKKLDQLEKKHRSSNVDRNPQDALPTTSNASTSASSKREHLKRKRLNTIRCPCCENLQH